MNAIDPKLAASKPLTLYGVELPSRLILGTARYPSPQAIGDADLVISPLPNNELVISMGSE